MNVIITRSYLHILYTQLYADRGDKNNGQHRFCTDVWFDHAHNSWQTKQRKEEKKEGNKRRNEGTKKVIRLACRKRHLYFLLNMYLLKSFKQGWQSFFIDPCLQILSRFSAFAVVVAVVTFNFCIFWGLLWSNSSIIAVKTK